jgi:hypothetical protein
LDAAIQQQFSGAQMKGETEIHRFRPRGGFSGQECRSIPVFGPVIPEFAGDLAPEVLEN